MRLFRFPSVPTSRPSLAPALALGCAAVAPAFADCIDDAAARHGVHPVVLRAIGWHESRLDTSTVVRNGDGSVDRGAFQINSVHLPRLASFGIDAPLLLDGCTGAEVAAWHYRQQVDRFGNTWVAVGAYHSRTPALAIAYADRVATVLMNWSVLPRGPLPSGASPATPAAVRGRSATAPPTSPPSARELR